MDSTKLQKILQLHKDWLVDRSQGQRADLCNADLRDADLCNADLRYANLRYADLRDANLRYANLRYANLRHANLRDDNLRYANLRYANLRHADLSYADLRDADLCNADLDYSCWPLWCGTINVKLCKKLQSQLLYHAFAVCDIKPNEEQIEFIKENFHRYNECEEKKEK